MLWTEFTSTGGGYYNKVDLKEMSAQDGSVGRTVMREIRLTAGAPSDIAVEWVGENREIAPVPMIGGRSCGPRCRMGWRKSRGGDDSYDGWPFSRWRVLGDWY